MSRKPSSLLLIDSQDRYIGFRQSAQTGSRPNGSISGIGLATYTDIFLRQRFLDGNDPQFPGDFDLSGNKYPGNRFTLFANQPFIYGAISTISVSQIQFYYSVPTITPKNNSFWIFNRTKYEAGLPYLARITIPLGFYSVVELCAMIEWQIRNSGLFDYNFRVEPNFVYGVDINIYEDIMWTSFDENGDGGDDWCFVNPLSVFGAAPWQDGDNLQLVYRTYQTLAITKSNCGFPDFPNDDTIGNFSPVKFSMTMNLLYTPYVDIASNLLTKYQDVKDTDTKPVKQSNFIARVYLCGQGQPQNQAFASAPGARPFYTVATLTNTKIIQWSPDEAVYNLDFELRDQYGELLFWQSELAPSEFQITLLCAE